MDKIDEEIIKSYCDYSPEDIKGIIRGKDNLQKARLMIENNLSIQKGGKALLTTADINALTKSLSEKDRYELSEYIQISERISKNRFYWALISANLKLYKGVLKSRCDLWQMAEDDTRSYNIIALLFNCPEVFSDQFKSIFDGIRYENIQKNLERIKHKYDRYGIGFDEKENGTISVNRETILSPEEVDGAISTLRNLLSQVKAIFVLMDKYEGKYPIARKLIPSDIEYYLRFFGEDLAHTKKYSRREWLTLRAEKNYRKAKQIEPYAIYPDLSEVEPDNRLLQRGYKVFNLI